MCQCYYRVRIASRGLTVDLLLYDMSDPFVYILFHSNCFSRCCRIKIEISFFTERGTDAGAPKGKKSAMGKCGRSICLTLRPRSGLLEQQLKREQVHFPSRLYKAI